MVREIRYALRSLRRTPWYSLTVVSVVALSMALSATVFAIVDGVLFKPLAYTSPDRVFALSPGFSTLGDYDRQMSAVSPAELTAWREALPDVRMTAFTSNDFTPVGPDDSAPSAHVDLQFFEVIGTPIIGRGFEPADFQTRLDVPAAVVTYEFWRRHLGGEPSAIGRSFLDRDGHGIRVVGILPKTFAFPTNTFAPDVVTPLVITNTRAPGRSLSVWLRLPNGATVAEIAGRLTAAARTFGATAPVPSLRPNATERARILSGPFDVVRLDPIRDVLTNRFRRSAWIVFSAAAVLVLLACLNVTGLGTARVQEKWRDLVLRRALGAGYGDLIRQMATESAVIVMIGALAGIWLAQLLLHATLAVMSRSTYFLKVPAIDVRVLAVSGLTATFCVALVSFLPARAAWQATLRGQPTPRRRGIGWSIISGQVAIASVMTIGGTLVTGSLLRIWDQSSGFDASRTALLQLGTPKDMSAPAIEAFLSTIRRLKGVAHAGAVAHPLLERAFNGSEFDVPSGATAERASPAQGTFPIESMPVTSGYLQAAGMLPIDGRLPTDAEFATGAHLIVVSEIAARQYWLGQRAVGQILVREGTPFTVAGVVRDARYMAFDMEPQGAIYWPSAASARPWIGNMLVAGTTAGGFRLHDLEAAVRAACRDCVVYKSQTLEDTLADSIRQRRFNAWLFSCFGVVSLVVVGTGILGLVAMTTSRRTKEIGIRMAIGSTPSEILRQILREQFRALALGLLAGGCAAAWAVQFLKSYLYKTTVYDTWAWAGAIAAIVIITMVGAAIPSMKASRVDPIRALRTE